MTATVPSKPRDDGSSSVAPILLGLAAVLWVLAAVSVWVGRSFDARVDRGRAWPTTGGAVVRSEVIEFDYRDPADGQTRRKQRLDFAYTYEVGSRSHEASNFDVSGAWPAGGSMSAFAAEYPVGRQVQVHYDPDNPAHAGLSVEGPGQTGGFQILALTLFALGIPFAGFGVRSLVRRRATLRQS